MKSTVALSAPQSRMIRGYEMRRLPLGAFLQALDALEQLPGALVSACFPGMSASQAWEKIKKLDADSLAEAMLRMAAAAPREAVRLICAVTDAKEEELLSDPAVGLDGLAEMLLALWELNRLENFLRAVRLLVKQAKAAVTAEDRAGYSG